MYSLGRSLSPIYEFPGHLPLQVCCNSSYKLSQISSNIMTFFLSVAIITHFN